MAARARMKDFGHQHQRTRLDKAKAVLLHHAKVGEIRAAYQSMVEAQLLLVEAASDVAYLKDKNTEIKQRLEEEKQNAKNFEKEMDTTRAVAKEAQEQIVALLGADQTAWAGYLDDADGLTVDQVESEIAAENARLNLIAANNTNAVEEYETWTRKIERERTEHESQEARVRTLEEAIAKVRGQWEPRLDELVGRINDAFGYNFEQISCAGEVGVHKDEDFEKWAVEIKVKFRCVDPSSLLRTWPTDANRCQQSQ